MLYSKNVLLFLGFVFSALLINGQDVIYVSQSSVGLNTGDSWENAYSDFQSALGEAMAGDQIWVAQGIYVPGDDPLETFTLVDGVEMYGGFQGNESQLNQRDPSANPTILSGDLNQDDDYGAVVWYSGFSVNTPNSYHVVSGLGLSRTTTLDGFIIEAGYVQITLGWTFLRNSGGGLFLQNSSPIVRNCVFRRNLAWNGSGAAIYTSGGHPRIVNSSFEENYTSLGRGGAIANEAGGDLTVISSSFTDNRIVGADIAQALGGAIYSGIQAGTVWVFDSSFENNTLGTFYAIAQNPNYGGAIYSAGEFLKVYNSKFTDNDSHLGGAIAVYSNLLMVNSLLNNNVAYPLEGGAFSFGDRGGAIYFAGTSADGSVITNSTVVNNSAGEGGGIFNAIAIPFTLNNSIVYGNEATGEDVWILKAQIGGGFDPFYSCVEALLQTEPGEDPPNPADFPGCIDTDPMLDFTDSSLILLENSPCIDAGKNSYYVDTWPTEGLAGNNRFWDNPEVDDTGQGMAPIIDMGATENVGSGICDQNDIAQPTGLSVNFSANQFTLSWTAIPGTGPCQIQAGTSFATAQSIVVQGSSPSSKTLPLSYLTQGETYGWRIRCACATSPTVAGPWSAIDYFSVPSGIGSGFDFGSTEEKAFKVFPNPGHDNYTVQLVNKAAAEIVVRNVLGQVVGRFKLSSGVLRYDFQLNGPSGLYFFELIDESNHPIETIKVMKL